MDLFKYIKNNFIVSAETMGFLNDFKLYVDNDSKHNSYVAKSWLLYNCSKVLQTPSQSLDICNKTCLE
ncbi:hypothetical protein WH47_02785 [Habropoda laboriosa]|uniref:Histone-lysine N-methyltransferase SETMAR n=1 Tax=Habropoda laboriosa TaxID=597456 RepID=A0A0L7QYQ8_9HYME|nr:hypothetical protein WH47_02785 [Habropoda laboriosa]